MQRALLLILSFSVLMLLPLLSVYVYGQNMTKDDDLSAESSFTLIHYFIGTVIVVATAAVIVVLWIKRQTNSLREHLEDHTDKKIKDLKDDLIKQIDKVENRITFIERTAMLKSIRDADDLIRDLGGKIEG